MTHEEDAERFAARLRMLKERAGTSFEVLAKRTGISRSSLHRYCSGTKLPVNYGAVHAFAKGCGATNEELQELHRLWALADAGRASLPSPEPTADQQEPKPDHQEPKPDRQEPEPEEGAEPSAPHPQPVTFTSRPHLRLTALSLVTAVFLVGTVATIAVMLRTDQESNPPTIVTSKSATSALATVRVFNIEGNCKSRADRVPSCSMGLARNPRLKYDANNVVSHRVWHDDVLQVDCVLYDGDRVEDEAGVGTTRWFRVRLTSEPDGHAWLPAVRSHDNPAVPTCA